MDILDVEEREKFYQETLRYAETLRLERHLMALKRANFKVDYKKYREFGTHVTSGNITNVFFERRDAAFVERLMQLGLNPYPKISDKEHPAVYISSQYLTDIIGDWSPHDMQWRTERRFINAFTPPAPLYYYANPLNFLAQHDINDILDVVVANDFELGKVATMPLSIAIKRGNVDMVNTLLIHGADTNFSPHPNIPLPLEIVLSSEDYDTNLFQALVIRGVDPYINIDRDPVIFAARGPVQLEQFFSTFGTKLIDKINSSDETLMMAIVRHDKYGGISVAAEMLRVLVQYGASDDLADGRGFTVWDYTEDNERTIMLLNVLRKLGLRPGEKRHPVIVWQQDSILPPPNRVFKEFIPKVTFQKYFVPPSINKNHTEHIPYPTTMMGYAAYTNDFPLIQLLASEGNSFDATFDDPLALAARNGSLDIVQYIVGDRQNLGKVGTAALSLATLAEVNAVEIVDFLLSRGADPNYPVVQYPQPLQTLLLNVFSEEIFEMLINAGAELNIKYYGTPVLFSCREGKRLTKFVESGGYIDMQDDDGNTFLMVTALRRRNGRRSGEWETVMKTLVQLRADPTITNNDGYTVLTLPNIGVDVDAATFAELRNVGL